MSYRSLINKFTSGEFDPKFLGQVDYDGYRKGARKLRNVLCTPQGAGQRRFGSIHNVTLTDVERGGASLIGFEYLSDLKYWILLKDDLAGGVVADIYQDNTFIISVPLPQYNSAQIPDIRYVSDINKIILLHEASLPVLLQRIDSANWLASTIVLSLYPGEDFSALDSPTNNYTNNGTTFTPNAADATTITASTAVFTSNHAGYAPNGGGFFVGNGGIFRIMTVNAAGTVATGYSTEDFADTSAIPGAESFLAERAWGNGEVIDVAPGGIARGYPRHGDFFQGRLVLGGSPSSPGTPYASEVKDYFSFDNSNADPASGWGVEAGVSGSDQVQDIIASKSLVLLTNRGTSATSILTDSPTTPGNVFLNTQGKEPSRNMDGSILNNQVLFADRSGNTIWSMIYDIPDTGYTIANASILSSHLIRNPFWSDVFDPSTVDGRYYLLVNGDGTMAILNSILEQNINAWTLAETLGSYLDVACVVDEAKVLTERQVGTGAVTQGYANVIYTADSTFNVFHAVDAGNSPVGSYVLSNEDDYLLIGNKIKFTKLFFDFSIASAEDLELTFEFLANTGSWEEFSPTDDTDGFQQSDYIEWTEPAVSNWLSQPIPEIDRLNGTDENTSYYWIRIKRGNDNTDAIIPYLFQLNMNVKNVVRLEQLSFDVYMDAQTSVNQFGTQLRSDALGIVEDLEHLAGNDAFFFADEFPIGTFYVEFDGVAELGIENANRNITVGLDYKPLMVPMPLVALLQNGYMVYEPQKIKSMYIDYYQSLGITVQSQGLPGIVAGEFMTDQRPIPTSGVYELPIFNGWDPRGEIVISQSYPAPMVIRGISYEVEIT